MRKIIIPFIFSILYSYSSLAQNSIPKQFIWNSTNDIIIEEVYIFDKWENGSVYFKNKSSLKTGKYNYSILSERMHLLRNKDTLEIKNPFTIDSIIINNRKFIYTYFEENKKMQHGYFEEICTGGIKLLKRYQCFYIKKNTKDFYKNTSGNYAIKYEYYSQKENRIAGKFKLKKKTIFNIFPSHKEEIKAYLKKNNINKEVNLINLFKYYNSLQ